VQQRSAPRTVLRFERTFPNRTHAPPPQLREKYYAAFVQTTMTRTSQHQLSRSRRVTAAVAAAAAAVAVFFVAASSFDSANALAFRQHQHQHNNNNYMKSDVAVSRRGALATAAASAFGLVSASAGFGGVGVLPAYAAAGGGMTKADYDRIKLGYQQITYLLDNFEQETTTCRENGGECKRDADPIRRVLGLRSTSDPLFQIEKVFDKVKDMDLDIDKLERFFEASEEFNSATNMSNSMAFISQVRTRSKIKTTIQGKNVAKQRNLHPHAHVLSVPFRSFTVRRVQPRTYSFPFVCVDCCVFSIRSLLRFLSHLTTVFVIVDAQGGGQDQVLKFLLESKKQVEKAQQALKTIMEVLDIDASGK